MQNEMRLHIFCNCLSIGTACLLTISMQLAADIDHNGTINEPDAVILLKYNADQLLGERVSLYELVP